MAMAARSPAPPPPTIRTSCAARMTLSLTSPLLVRQHLSVVVDDHAVAAPVVELFPAAAAPAGVPQVLGDQTLVVLGQVLLAAVPASARREPRVKREPRRHSRPTSQLRRDSDLRRAGRACSDASGLGRATAPVVSHREPRPVSPSRRQHTLEETWRAAPGSPRRRSPASTDAC